MSFLPGMYPSLLMSGERDATVQFVDYGMSSSNASSYNFGTKNIGPAHASRVLIVWFTWNPQLSATFSHFSVDGTPMNFRVGSSSGTFTQMRTLSWPTGTTATITMGASAQMLSCYWMMWSAYYLKNEAPTASKDIGTLGNPVSDNINVSAGGVIVGGSGAPAASSSGFTWSGLTEDLDVVGGISSTVRISGASAAFHAAQSPLTVSTNANSANHQQMLAAFR